MRKVRFDKALLARARKNNHIVWVDSLSPDGTCFIASSTRTAGVRVRIYETAWEYDEARIFYNNDDLRWFVEEQERELELLY